MKLEKEVMIGNICKFVVDMKDNDIIQNDGIIITFPSNLTETDKKILKEFYNCKVNLILETPSPILDEEKKKI